jgi:hypothetical protein
MSPTRLVPEPTITRDDVSGLAHEHGWTFQELYAADEEGPFEKVWLAPDGATTIHWIEDPVIAVDYLVIGGHDEVRVAQQISDQVPTLTREDMRRLMHSAGSWDEMVRAVGYVAATAPSQFDPEVFGWLERGLRHENPDVRRVAVAATAYPGWPELRAPLRAVAESDPEPDLRESATALLAHLEER